jgi:hypothetical protein
MTVSRDGPWLSVEGLHDGPHGIGPGAARVLLRGRQFAELHVEGPDESHGVYEAPLAALWRLFAGLEIFPVGLVEVTA